MYYEMNKFQSNLFTNRIDKTGENENTALILTS
jgi:hypothetical protein